MGVEQQLFPREVPCDLVKVGEIVLVRAGEAAPVDGRVIHGEGVMDESALTGESLPVAKKVGDGVFGGSLCQAGVVQLECTAVAGQSGAQRVQALMADIAATRPPAQEAIDSLAGRYTWLMLLLAGGTALLTPLLVGGGWRLAALRGLSLLVLACPCALAIAAPLPFLAALAASTRNGTGVLFRSAAALETLGRVTVVGLDKTGTLTEGRFCVVGRRRLQATSKLEEGLVRRLAASVEAMVAHRLSAALVMDAIGCVTEAYHNKQGGGSVLADVTGLKVVEGVGVEGTCVFPSEKGRPYRVCVGNEGWLPKGGVDEEQVAGFRAAHPGMVHLFVVVDGVPEMALALTDKLRAEAQGMLVALGEMGVEAAMLTGDSAEVARAVDRRLVLSNGKRLLGEVRARMKPAGKLQWVKGRQERKTVEEEPVVVPVVAKKSKCSKGCCKSKSTQLAAAAVEEGRIGDKGGQDGGGKEVVVVPAPAGATAVKGKRRKDVEVVAMVGDGVNDGPALTSADVGIAMGAHGAALAVSAAGVVLLADDLRRVPQAMTMAQAVRRVVRANVAWALLPKLIVLVLVSGGWGRLWMAVASDGMALGMVLLNGLRPLWMARGIYGDE